MTDLPQGFSVHVANMGIKDDTNDVMILHCETLATTAGVFTQSRFAGPSVAISRHNVSSGTARAVTVISKNANVATGDTGYANAEEITQLVAAAVDADPSDIIIGSTGVIGVQYPMERIRSHLLALQVPFLERSAEAAASAIMTTDTHPKVASAPAGHATVVGFAKGVGMIEPDMATMIAVITTDAQIAPNDLNQTFRRVIDRTFNALSIDTDTSTSDMAVVVASGITGPVDDTQFETALSDVCLNLTRQLAADGEGAETLIVVDVASARDDDQARRVAKAIINSPLVKTAIHGRDPNWGRVAMAIGKCQNDTDIDQQAVTIRFGEQEVYPNPATPEALIELQTYLAGDEVHIGVDLGVADGTFTAYGCDLTDGYVRVNADYTT
ncbi:MAG: bifunctional glutamate N-acetyltransferase/amino-acid acetyltransferase ArgJ [Acidimicrobiales bacterium]|nr:bifunctional glutamate N-acetyltransferase/amino-acid acetyltransferase ArgJ [Acidimicrobiales bacterium]